MSNNQDHKTELTDLEKSRQRTRSIAIAVCLIALVAIFYAITIVHLGGSVAQRNI